MTSSGASSFDEVSRAEQAEISAQREKRGVPAGRDSYIGLALSGGGIRSATFNLGVLQGLAGLGVLRCFDYLSTVSGGGYIGSWLVAWLKRLSFKHVTAGLDPEQAKHPGKNATPQIEFLRDYSNYLTPRAGLLTADTWTAIVIYVRNLLLNLLILVAAALGLLLLPHELLALASYLKNLPVLPVSFMFEILAFVLFAIFFWPALRAAGGKSAAQPDSQAGETQPSAGQSEVGASQGLIVASIGFCLFASAYLAACWAGGKASGYQWTRWGFLAILFWLGLSLYQWLINRRTEPAWNQPAAFLVSLAGYALLSVPAVLLVLVQLGKYWPDNHAALTTCGVPIAVLVFLLAAALQVGLTGMLLRNEVREWTARLGAWLLILSLAWASIFAIAIYGPQAVTRIWSWLAGTLTVAWAVHTIAGVWSAFNSKSGDAKSGKWLNLLAVTAPPVFVAGLLLLLSYGISKVPHKSPGAEVIATFLLLLVAWLLSLRIDINEFSMHTFYRNRLVRCYLGASRPDQFGTDPCRRRPNRFTGFDPRDDVLLATLTSAAKPHGNCDRAYAGPYPILCAALNLTHGERLAWQERKAESFTFTPLYCGGTISDTDSYLPTGDYAYPPDGVYLGTALAISGAAVSPLVGFHYSSAAGFLMTVFNARLGQWLANPARPDIKSNRFGPRIGFWWLLEELFGLMNDRSPFVYLSDGGLFENLGIYELVRRRVKYIVACDASADPGLEFGDLGNAIRKCRSDFGVEIQINLDDIRRDPATGFSKSSFAVGTIHYKQRYGPDFPDGKLIYLKASLTKDDPSDVLEYHADHSEFPHQSTADQWFDESQFESYRRLGQQVAQAAFAGLQPDHTCEKLLIHLDGMPSAAAASPSTVLEKGHEFTRAATGPQLSGL